MFTRLAVLLTLVCAPGLPQERGQKTGGKPKAPAAEAEDERYVERVGIKREKGSLHMELSLTNPDPSTPMLVLFHGGRSSRGEYRPMVPRLRALGYNCLAVDLTPGVECREIENLTAKWAYQYARKITLLDGEQDILDALGWAREKYATGKLIAWGSSFSASLALVVAAEHPELVDGVIAFSPGEYFAELGKSPTWVRDAARRLGCPVFLGLIAESSADWTPIHDALAEGTRASVVRPGSGVRGSQVLWPESHGSEAFWTPLLGFLGERFPAPPPPPFAEPLDGEGK